VSAVTAPAAGTLEVLRDYLSLLKLRIVVLLDATAVGVMIPAAHGHPRLVPVLAVLAGGTLPPQAVRTRSTAGSTVTSMRR